MNTYGSSDAIFTLLFNLAFSFILTWGIGLTPPLLIRYVLVRRPLGKKAVIPIVIVFWFVNLVIFTALGSQSKTHTALFLVALVSYYILNRGYTKWLCCLDTRAEVTGGEKSESVSPIHLTPQAAESAQIKETFQPIPVPTAKPLGQRKLRKRRKWIFITLASTAILITLLFGGFFIIKNKVSAYLENLAEKNPLLFATATGNLEKVDRLISEGANPNATAILGHTPLIQATRGHRSVIAERLLLAGANPNQRDKFGWTALHHAITPSDGADLDLIGILVKHGADVNIQDNRLRTPLHRAAQYGQLQAVLLLLKYGTDPNIKDCNGWTPADRAGAHPEIQTVLTSYNR